VSLLDIRPRRLEERARGGTCPECGGPHAPERIAIDRIPEGAEEVCPACKRPLWRVIKVVYEGDEEGEGSC